MSTVNNINTKEMLTYVLTVLQYYGITSIKVDNLIKAKQDDQVSIIPLTHLLFELTILHIFDFDYNLQLDISIICPSLEQKQQIVLTHLCQMQCPYLYTRNNQIGLDFNSSRKILLCIGWIMAVADVFGKIQEKVFAKKAKQIQEMKPSDIQTRPAKKDKITFPNQQNTLSGLYKSIVSKCTNIQNLKTKKAKLLKNLQIDLDRYNIKCSVSELLNNDKQFYAKRQQLSANLIECIEYESNNMRFRKSFWAWLETVVNQHKIQICQHSKYRMEPPPEIFVKNLTIDMNALEKFMKKIQKIEKSYKSNIELLAQIDKCWQDRYKNRTQKQNNALKVQQNKIKSEINQEFPDFFVGDQTVVNSFIGIELDQLLQNQESVQQDFQKPLGTEAEHKLKTLQQLCQQTICNLQSLKFI